MPPSERPPGLFATAPAEVIDYFDKRDVALTERWTDLAPHEHALKFTVARTAGHDVINELHDAVRKAVVDRIPFEQFQRELTPLLQAKGWWGKGKDGAQLGSLRRLKTIYWANVRSAHAAGEWARTTANKELLPYLIYKISVAAEKRPEHVGWVGTTLPVDHPWWRTHYPPNGWHCQCRVEQIGEARADRQPPEKRKAPPLDIQLWRDKVSGVVWRVPKGIDPGWQTNPGATRETVANFARQGAQSELLGAVPPEQRASLARTIAEEARRSQLPPMLEAAKAYIRQPLSPAREAAGKLAMPIASVTDRLLEGFARPVTAALIDVSVARLAKGIRTADKNKPGHAMDASDFDRIQDIVDAPDEIAYFSDRHVDVMRTIGGVHWMVALSLSPQRDQMIVITFYRADDAWAASFRSRTRNRDVKRKD